MIPILLVSLLVAVTAKPNVPSLVPNTRDISSVATSSSLNIAAHKTNVVNYYRPEDNAAVSNNNIKHDKEINSPSAVFERRHAASPYGHYGLNYGHAGQLFNHHVPSASYFWFPPALSLPQAGGTPGLGTTSPSAPASQAPAQPTPITVPIVPLAAQLLNQLLWMPLEQLLINVNQSLMQGPKEEKS